MKLKEKEVTYSSLQEITKECDKCMISWTLLFSCVIFILIYNHKITRINKQPQKY